MNKSNIVLFSTLILLTSCAELTLFQKDYDYADLQKYDPLNAQKTVNQADRKEAKTLEQLTNRKVIELSLKDAVLIGLENNKELQIKKLSPVIKRVNEQISRSSFDANLAGEISSANGISKRSGQTDTTTSSSFNLNNTGKISLNQNLYTGTKIGVEASINDAMMTPFASTRIGVNLTQSILKGYGSDYNLAVLKSAQLDTVISEYELRGFTETLVSQMEQTYWDYILAQRQLEIYKESLNLAKRQLKDTELKIKIGKLAESELIASQAEVALREEALITARTNFETTRLKLLKMLNINLTNIGDKEIALTEPPEMTKDKLDDVDTHIKNALNSRPEIYQARLDIQKGNIQLVTTQNGILPKLDLFVNLGKSGYSDALIKSAGNIISENYDLTAGMTLGYPLGNREAENRQKLAELNYKNAIKSLDNLSQLIETDIRLSYLKVNLNREKIDAANSTFKLQEQKLKTETAKFNVGKSNSFLVAQAQRDLLSSQISRIQTVINYLKDMIEFYRLEGTLLDRRGITIKI